MKKNILLGLLAMAVGAVLFCSCNSQPDFQLPPAVQPPPAAPPLAPPSIAPTPAVPVPAAPLVAPPPDTPLIPIADESPTPSKKGDGIDKALPGMATSGDELLGNYMCKIDTNDLPLGLSPPAAGCNIFKTGSGKLKIGSRGAAGMSGSVTDTKATGFFIIGKYALPGNKFDVKARMVRKGAGKFVGKGRGVLNGNKSKGIKYKLTMTQ